MFLCISPLDQNTHDVLDSWCLVSGSTHLHTSRRSFFLLLIFIELYIFFCFPPPKSGITASWGRLFPNFLRNHHTDIQRNWTILHDHQQCRSVPFSTQPLQQRLSSVFLILVILVGVRWDLRVVLICISLMTKDVEHFLKCLSAILDSSVESSLLRSYSIFLTGLCDLLVSNFLSSLYILEIKPLSDVGLVKIFPHSVGCRFVFLIMSFAFQMLFR